VGDNGTVLRFNGTSWVAEAWEEDTPWKNTNFHSVWAASASKVWVGGTDGTIIQYDGTDDEWTQQDTPGGLGHIRDMWGVSAQNVWAVTDGKIIRFQNSWNVEDLSDGSSVQFKSIFGTKKADGAIGIFAVGDSGKVYARDEFSWAEQDKPQKVLGSINWTGVWGGEDAPASGTWLLGTDGTVAY
jgi:hypothetical protein